jgi:hypothetical protein
MESLRPYAPPCNRWNGCTVWEQLELSWVFSSEGQFPFSCNLARLVGALYSAVPYLGEGVYTFLDLSFQTEVKKFIL